MSWGVEHLTTVERVALGVNAGLDQFGGEDDPALLMAAIDQGLISLRARGSVGPKGSDPDL